MPYEGVDRPRYRVPTLGNVYNAVEAYSWPLVNAATGSFFLPDSLWELFGFWGGTFCGPPKDLPSKGTGDWNSPCPASVDNG